MNNLALRRFVLAASALIWHFPNLHAQDLPTINTQPASQTVLPGTNVAFSVAVAGTGPFSYQWRFNGTNLPNNLITTVAGSATYVVDGIAATNVNVNDPVSVALDVAGNVYIADSDNSRVRMVATNGNITTVAGNGAATDVGDGGAATNASLHFPQGVCFDATDNLFIADNNNNRVRKVTTNGTITTVAGNGYGANYSGGTYGGDGGAATNASLYRPNNVAFDAVSNWYIADIANNRIRKVTTNGNISTVAGGGNGGNGGAATNAGLALPASVALDAVGNLYIADLLDSRIRKVGTNGIITTVAGNGGFGYSGDGGAATNTSLSEPQDASLDTVGNLYIADTANNRIRKVTTNGTITTVAGNGIATYAGDGGAATNASLNGPWFAAFDAAGNQYIADLYNNRIRMVNTNGIITTVAGNGIAAYAGDGGAATNASLNNPACVALNSAGNLFIADWYNNRIREVHLAGDPTLTLGSVSVTNAGNYTVVITSSYGSVTSAVAALTITGPNTPPQIITRDAAFGFQTNRFGFNVTSAISQTVVVDGSTNLMDWFPLFTNTTGSNLFYFFDPDSISLPGRFYRARLP